LKTEQIYGNKHIKEQMELDIFEFIEIWYNRKEDIPLKYKNMKNLETEK
jgi:hypothetical protein